VSVLVSALDHVEYGVVLLDEDLKARFINRAYYGMWSLPPPPMGKIYSFPELMQHGANIRVWDIAPEAIEDYVARRIELVRQGNQPPVRLRLANGRVLRFVCKPLPSGGRMLTYEDVSEYVRVSEELEVLATTDDLTKLLNRRQFFASFQDEFERARRQGRPLSLIMIDADHFKDVNDRHGHAVGDEVLRVLAERCRGLFRATDILGRIGGEEFAAALAETDLAEALDTAERVRREVAGEPITVGTDRLRVTVSVGVAAHGGDPADSADLLQRADRALYAAKAGGRNRVSTDPGLS
jgi:diguanylate cyclase (GGDEF)-like protein